MDKERWKPVTENVAYFVSDFGRVYSTKTQRILNPQEKVADYPKVGLYSNGVVKSRAVHSLVAQAFLGSREEGHVVRHLDGNKKNSKLSNLSYGTYSENSQDTVEQGNHQWASRTNCLSGHEYTEENTYVYFKNGNKRRVCRICRNAAQRKWNGRRVT